MRRHALRFLASAAATSAALLAALTAVIYWNAELYTVGGGARAQLRGDGAYLRSIWHDYYAYKLAMYELRPTSVLSVGSSRAMPVRALLFRNSDHYSAGGTIESIEDAVALMSQLRKFEHRPKVVLLFVDFAWFLDDPLPSYNNTDRSRFERLTFLYQSAFVHISELLANLAAVHYAADPETGGRLIGARAQRLGDGFRLDGSMRFYGFETGTHYIEPDLYPLLADPDGEAARADVVIHSQRRRWWNGRSNETALMKFRSILESLKDMGSSIVLVMAPVAPHLAMALKSAPELRVFRTVKIALDSMAQGLDIPFYDFTDIPLYAANCWVDRYHASEGAYAWMLKAIYPDLARRNHPAAAALDPQMLAAIAPEDCLRSLSQLAPDDDRAR